MTRITPIFAALLLTIIPRLADAAEPLFGGPFILGSSVYSARDFATEIAAHVGKPTSAPMLESLRDAIRVRYSKDGYIAPIISIPLQDARSTNPRFIIHEARISAIEIQGEPGPYRAQLEQITRALQQSSPIRKEQLRVALARISHLPGISSRPLFDPRPESTNEFLLILRVQYKPVAGRIEINNAGTKELGRELLSADMATNNVLGLQEQMRFTGAVSSRPDRYHFEEARIQRSFSDTTGFVDVSGSAAVPDQDIHFSNIHFSTGLNQEWHPDASTVVSVGASFNGDNGSVRDAAANNVIEDHERNVALGLTLALNDNSHPGSLFVGAQRGLDVAGSAVNEGAYSHADAGYVKYLLDAEQLISLSDTWNLKINLNGQVTSAVLPILDRFAFGGVGFGAAFDPGSVSGDSGAEFSAQLAHVIRTRHWGLQYVRVYARSDTAVAWNHSPYFYHREEASSAGGGVFARWPHVLSTLELSTPIDQPSYISSPSLRTFGSIAYVF